MKIQIEVEVLDPDICKKCDRLDVDVLIQKFYAGDSVIDVYHSFECPNVHFCEKLKKRLESAKQTTPVIDDRKE